MKLENKDWLLGWLLGAFGDRAIKGSDFGEELKVYVDEFNYLYGTDYKVGAIEDDFFRIYYPSIAIRIIKKRNDMTFQNYINRIEALKEIMENHGISISLTSLIPELEDAMYKTKNILCEINHGFLKE